MNDLAPRLKSISPFFISEAVRKLHVPYQTIYSHIQRHPKDFKIEYRESKGDKGRPKIRYTMV